MTTEPTVQRLKQGRVECTVTFSESELAPAEQQALEHLSKDLKIEGFRPGKIPPDLAKQHIDRGALFEHTIRNALPSVLETLIEEHEIQSVIPPKVEAESIEPVVIKITFVEKPEVKLKGVDKIKIEKKEPKVDEKDVNNMIDYILKQHQKTTVVERAVQKDDQVIMDFWGEDENGKEIENTRSKDYKVVVGSGTLIPGFEDELIGVKPGDTKSFEITFPENYQAEHLRNKKATFHVTINRVEEIEKQELTDEFAQKVLNEKSAEAFRKTIEDSMIQQEEQVERKRRENLLLDAVRDTVQVDFAQELIEEETRAVYHELEQQLGEQNMDMAQWMKNTGKNPEEMKKELEERAEKRLKLRLGMQTIVEEKEVEISEADMKAIIEEFLAPLSDEEREKMREAYEPGKQAYEQLLWQKKVEKVLEEFLAKS